MSRYRPAHRRRDSDGSSSAAKLHEQVESWPDGDWVVRHLTGSSATKPYRCPGCDQLIPPVTPHIVAWPVEGETLSGGGISQRRHWHTACWRARDRRGPS